MYARVVTSQLKYGKTEEAAGIWLEQVVPILKQTRGFKGAHLLADREMGRAFSITIWDTEENMNATEKNGQYQRTVALFAAMFTGEPLVEHLEVLAQV